MNDLGNLDLMQLVMRVVKENKETTPPTLSFLSRYILIITEEPSLVTCTERDVEKVEFSAQQGNEVIFTDPHKAPLVCKLSEYGTKWLLVDQISVYGTLLCKAYEDLIAAIKGSLPHHLRDKVK